VPDRVEHWLACREKRCCSYLLVYVTGDDVARIARSIAVEPWLITAPIEANAAHPGAFALDARGGRYRLALVRTRLSDDVDPSCEFLMRVGDGAARCGLGDGRPQPCRSFPAQLVDGEISLAPAECSCDWSQVTIDQVADTELLRAERGARERYDEVVRDWNDYVATLDAQTTLTHRDFCRYLMDAYPQ
jgi:Fe-S-cluster containining protein